jgi:S1-C subfamily serine protease
MTHSSSFLRRVVSIMAVFLALSAALCFAQNTPGLTIPSTKAPEGALVDSVTADGPAAKAGISVHDIITAVEGTAVQSLNQILEALARHKPGDTMELTVARASDGSRTDVTMTLGANPRDPSRAYMGLAVLAVIFLVPESVSPPAERQGPHGI